ncbi:hypothetical protein CBL_04216 [Carabus blaptoides fortunei]
MNQYSVSGEPVPLFPFGNYVYTLHWMTNDGTNLSECKRIAQSQSMLEVVIVVVSYIGQGSALREGSGKNQSEISVIGEAYAATMSFQIRSSDHRSISGVDPLPAFKLQAIRQLPNVILILFQFPRR